MRVTLNAPIAVDAAPTGQPGRRTISGIAAPYGVDAHASTGWVRLMPGSLPTEGPAPKLIRDHNLTEPIGIVTARVATDEAVLFEAKISRTAAGDEALTLAEDGVLDAVSVGLQVLEYHYEGDVLVVESADWQELSLVPFGAFPEARVLDVAATPLEAQPQAGAIEPTPAPVAVETDPDPDPETDPEPETPEEPETMEATIPTAPLALHAQPRKVTAGEYVAAMASGNPLPRVAAVVAEEDTGDIAGLLPEPLVGEVWNNLRFLDQRPMVTALGARAMPRGGETFYRRKVTQHTSVAEQLAQGDELASQVLTVTRVTVNKRTLGGVLDLSEQSVDWSDPVASGLVLEDMSLVYAQQTDVLLCAEIVAGMGTATATITDFTDGDEVIEDLYAAAAEIRSAGYVPTHLLMSTNVWAQIGAAKDSGGNRIFPYLGPSNAAGTSAGVVSPNMNPLGLQVVIDDNLIVAPATSACIMLAAPVVEFYEDNRGGIRVDMPATLQARLAFRGYSAVADIDLTAGALSLV